MGSAGDRSPDASEVATPPGRPDDDQGRAEDRAAEGRSALLEQLRPVGPSSPAGAPPPASPGDPASMIQVPEGRSALFERLRRPQVPSGPAGSGEPGVDGPSGDADTRRPAELLGTLAETPEGRSALQERLRRPALEPDRPTDHVRREQGSGPLPSPELEPQGRSVLAQALAQDSEGQFIDGARLGTRYRIVRLLGQGGMGAVYLARDLELGRDVALKVIAASLAADAALLRRFKREVQLSSLVTHPNVLRVFDLGEAGGVTFLTMQYIEGRSLAELILAERPLPLERAIALFRQVCEGLAAAHEKGVLHRDLKPQNVMVDAAGRVYLADFGLATAEAVSAMTRTGTVMGTPHYMSPEQVKGQPVDARSEVFSLGVMLYELLAGELPFQGQTVFEVMMRRTRGPPRPARELNPDITPRLQRVLERSLAIDPRERYGSVLELLGDLEAGQGGPARPRFSGRRWRRWAPAGMVVALVLVVAGGVVTWRATQGAARRLAVAVADFDDRTGEAGLEGLASLLITSLEQSPVLEVLPRARMRDLLRHAGKEVIPRIDEALGREVSALAGSRALLLATLHKFGEVYALELRAVDPGSQRQLFSLREQAKGKDSLPDLIDRVSAGVRRGLNEEATTIRSDSVRIAEAVTPNVDAWQHYFKGMDCYEGLIYAESYGECLPEFKKALAIDPDFALAHFQVAYLSFWEGQPRQAQKAALAPAMRHVEKLPARERLRIRGWAAYLDGRDAEAKALLRQAAEAAPEDKVAWYLAGEIPFHRDEFTEAIPLFEKVHELEPGWLTPAQHLVFALGSTGQAERLRPIAARLEKLGARPGPLVELCQAYLWIEPDRAIPTCQRAITAGAGPVGSGFLAIALLNRGERKNLEAHLKKMGEGSTGRTFEWYMGMLLRGQEGRWQEVLRIAREAGDPDDLWFHSTHAEQLVGLGDVDRLWRASVRAAAIDPFGASHLAVHLAYAGDLQHAAELAQYLPVGSPRVAVYEAVRAWRQGDLAGAIERLRALAAANRMGGDPSIPFPQYLLGEALAEAGRDAEAVAALQAFIAIPLHYPSWEYPRSLYYLARSQQRLGQAGARETIERLLELWRRADPEQPLLADARALGRTLGVR